MKKLVVVSILLMAFAGTVMGQADLSKFPDPIEPGNFLLSVGAGIGGIGAAANSYSSSEDGESYSTTTVEVNSFAIGGLVKAEWALPIPLTLGIEGGVIAAAGFKYKGIDLKMTGVLIPIFTRVAWHPNFGVSGLDPYIAAKAGGGIFSVEASYGSGSEFCIGFGGDIGVRYFFTPTIGAFLEGNFDMFMPIAGEGDNGGSATLGAAVVGVTFKF